MERPVYVKYQREGIVLDDQLCAIKFSGLGHIIHNEAQSYVHINKFLRKRVQSQEVA
jgi:hypothetical protein